MQVPIATPRERREEMPWLDDGGSAEDEPTDGGRSATLAEDGARRGAASDPRMARVSIVAAEPPCARFEPFEVHQGGSPEGTRGSVQFSGRFKAGAPKTP